MISEDHIMEWSYGNMNLWLWPDGAWSDGRLVLFADFFKMPDEFRRVGDGEYFFVGDQWRREAEIVDWEYLLPSEEEMGDFEELRTIGCEGGFEVLDLAEGLAIPLAKKDGTRFTIEMKYFEPLIMEGMSLHGRAPDEPVLVVKGDHLVGALLHF